MSDVTDPIRIELDVEGHDVEVVIHGDTIARAIERVEERNPGEINENGFKNIDLSRFVTVSVEPSYEKWGELADREFGEHE